MQKSFLYYKLSFVAFAIVLFTSCRKENGIDNDTVIKKPYGLYIGTSQGALLNTNDGELYKTIFPPDGYPQRSLVYSGPNIIMIKDRVHVSEDNGRNFNPKYFFAHPFPSWQSMMLVVPSHNRVYLSNFNFGARSVAYSEDNGVKWVVDGEWGIDVLGEDITSFAQLKNGLLLGHSAVTDSLYKRTDKNAKWEHVKAGQGQTSTGLPPAGRFYINRMENTLIATDYTGLNGVQYSDDNGLNWKQYQGTLPTRPLYATNAPFDQVLLVGTDSMGVYKLKNGTLAPANNGLEENTSVFAIIGKEDIYKNDATRRYIYIATDKGLYRSNDLGENWHIVQPGDYRALY